MSEPTSSPPRLGPPTSCPTSWGVAIIGCGLMGRRRALVAAAHPSTHVVAVVDSQVQAAEALADTLAQPTTAARGMQRAAAASDWRSAVNHPEVAIVVVCTPNAYLAPIALAALAAGKHVLIEKPMGATLRDAEALFAAALGGPSGEASPQDARAARGTLTPHGATRPPLLKVGFNHRYHPGLRHARERFEAGAIGRLTHLRACYGHGGRPGYDQEWRGNPELAGGGELTDQGVHLLDLLRWFAGDARRVVAFARTAAWPIAPLEDNAHAMLTYDGGVVAQLHSSWTQWKNLFRLEVFGDQGCLTVEGLGGSYGVETCTEARRNPRGGAPDMVATRFEGPDLSWQLEWDDFVRGVAALEALGASEAPTQGEDDAWSVDEVRGRDEVQGGAARQAGVSTASSPHPLLSGSPRDGLAVMRTLDALYRSVATGQVVELA